MCLSVHCNSQVLHQWINNSQKCHRDMKRMCHTISTEYEESGKSGDSLNMVNFLDTFHWFILSIRKNKPMKCIKIILLAWPMCACKNCFRNNFSPSCLKQHHKNELYWMKSHYKICLYNLWKICMYGLLCGS